MYHRVSSVLQYLAGVGLHDQPDVSTSPELQGVGCRRSQMHFELDAAGNARNHHNVALFQPGDVAGKDVSCAKTLRALRGQQNVSGTDSDTQWPSLGDTSQGNFKAK